MTRGSFSSSRWSSIVSASGGDAGLLEDGRGEPAFLVEQRQQEVFDVDLLVVQPDGELLGTLQGLAGLFGEAVDVHVRSASSSLDRRSKLCALGGD